MDEGLIDFGRGEVVPCPDLVDEIIEFIREDAEHFGCVDEVEHARTIVTRGTSAHWQLDTFNKAVAEGADEDEALRRVVDMLVKETLVGC